MADPKKNPLNSFVQNSAGSNDIRLPSFPKLQELVKTHGLHGGHEVFDQQMEEIKQTLEKTLNERFAGKPDVSISKGNV